MFLKWILLLSFIFPGFATAKRSQQTKKCSRYDLQQKNCNLKLGKVKVQVTAKKISLFDGTWRDLEDLPLQGEEKDWDSVEIRKLGKRIFLEFKIWDAPKGPVEIQSLVWSGYEIKDHQVKLKWQEVIQKRRRKNEDPVPAEEERPKGQFAEKIRPQFIYDKREPHKAWLDSHEKLNWKVGSKTHSEGEAAMTRPPSPPTSGEEYGL